MPSKGSLKVAGKIQHLAPGVHVQSIGSTSISGPLPGRYTTIIDEVDHSMDPFTKAKLINMKKRLIRQAVLTAIQTVLTIIYITLTTTGVI